MKLNFKLVDNVISDKHVKGFIQNEYKPKKVQFQLTKMIVYVIETFNTDRALSHANCIFRLSKKSGKFSRDITDRELEKCEKDCIVFKGTDSINKILNQFLQFKGETKKFDKKLLNILYT